MLRYIILAIVVLGLGFSLASQAKEQAEEKDVTVTAKVSVEKDNDAVVVELFTSQGCSSCPPAQVFLGDLARRADVIALEEHVDYWDQLRTVFGGTWKDPFSSHTWSERQADYNRLIMGNDSVYTPQLVIDGKLQEDGTRRMAVNSVIEQAKTLRRGKYSVKPVIDDKGQALVSVSGPGQSKPVRLVLALLQKRAETEVKGGENKGAKLVSHNIVKEMLVVGTWDGGKQDYKVNVPPLSDNESCAVLLQDPESMHILAGGVCGL